MPDQITDDQGNAITAHWFDDFAGDDEGRQEQLGKFESFDAFYEDYNTTKNADWRDGIAGDDDKFKSTLTRFADQGAFGVAFREAQQKIRSGQLRPELAEDADEAAIKDYREQNNIPLEAAGYLEDLPDGLIVGEDDKDLILDFMGAAHKVNADRKFTNAAIGWLNDFEESQQDAIVELDAEQSRETTDALRDDKDGWGKDYRTNMNLVKSVLSTYMGEAATEQLLNGRYQDGRGFMNDVNVLKGWANLARAVNDVAPLIAQDTEALQGLHDRIEEIEKYQKEHRTKYFKNEPMQKELRELYELRSKSEKTKDAA
jgi:hypothetical protein